jgi:hypothetical protein
LKDHFNGRHTAKKHEQNHGQNLEAEQAAAKAVLLAECDKLAAAGVTCLAVHFDKYGDDGAARM